MKKKNIWIAIIVSALMIYLLFSLGSTYSEIDSLDKIQISTENCINICITESKTISNETELNEFYRIACQKGCYINAIEFVEG